MDIPETIIVGIKFYVLGPDDILRLSNIEIKNSILFQNDKPYPYGIHDEHLGTTDNSWDCKTCGNEKIKCPGHCGHLVLKSRILSPLFIPHIYNILKSVCHVCSRYTAMKKDCPHCQKEQRKYERSKSNPFIITSVVPPEMKKRETPHNIYKIFSKIIPSDVEKLGYSQKFHPTHLLPNVIVVSPNSIRPDAKIATSNKHNSNDITILLQKVIDANTAIPMEITDLTPMTPELDEMVVNLNIAVSDMIKGPSNIDGAKQHIGSRPLNAIMRLLQGKGGSIRKNIIAKRAWNQARSIITCNTDLPLDTIGVPIYVARRIKKKVHVREYNYKECLIYYENGSKKYPGSTHIIRNGIKKCTDIINKTTKLQIGDILYRDIIDGDIVNFNRQPTLELSSITAIRLKVILDSTIQMNVGICSYFNSDFDGDAMNLQFPHSQETEAEIENLSSVNDSLINNKDTTIKASQVLDSKIGLADITNSKTRFSKYHFMNMCNVLPFVPQYQDKQWYTGYDLITAYLQTNKVFVNYSRYATINASLYKEFFKVDDADAKVVIEHGKMLSGILDNSSIGENVKYNLFHTIFNQYGYKHTIDAIYYLQQFALYHVCTYKTYSISFKDFYINNECYEKIKESITGPLDNSKVILKHALNRELIPPFGQTLNDYYENVQINNLETTDYVLKLLLSYISPDNNLFKAIVTGAKGKMFNLKNILAYVGTISLNGQRIKKNFSLERTLPYYTRFDESPQARGFVTDSYAKGLSPLSFIKHLYDSRLSLILKALSTATAGTRQRKDMKSFESARITNNRVVMTDFNIIQPIYGGDGFAQTYNEEDHIAMFSADLSDEQFEKEFNGKHFVKDSVSKEELLHLEEEFKKLSKIRKKHRHSYIDSNRVDIPINIFKIFKSFMIESTGQLPIISTIKKINMFLKNLIYIYTNEIQEQQQTKMLQYFKHAIRPIKIYVHSYFNIATLNRHKIDSAILDLTMQQIKFRLMRSLIIPGTPIGSRTTMFINQPLTQKILDSHHYSGLGSQVSARSFMDKFNEIFTCKDTSKLPTASMRIYFTDDVQTDYYYVKMAAFNMEMVLLKDIVSKYQILYDPYDGDDPVVKKFEKSTGLVPYDTLMDVCYKLYIDKAKIIIKNITAESIYMLLTKLDPTLHIVYNSRLDSQFYFKIYLSKSTDAKIWNLLMLKAKLEEEILSVLVKGVRNIYATSTQEEVRKYVAPDGRIESKNVYYIQTSGTNMEEILSYDKIDVYRTYSDSIIEMYNMFGVISARNIIYRELYLNLENIDNKHYSLYADLMTCTGECTSIDKNGTKKRHESLLARITDSSPIQLLTNAAMYRGYDEINSLSNAMLLSQVPHIGDNYNKFAVDLDAYENLEDNILDDL
jgi:DNA-directed RNA polymerase II subunit RPB1